MVLCEYTARRAQTLSEISFSETQPPVNMKILWLEPTTHSDAGGRICLDDHSHTFFEIHFVFCGQVYYDCGGKKMCLSAGDALFIPQNTAHRYDTSDGEVIKIALAFCFGKGSAVSEIFDGIGCRTVRFSDIVFENFNSILALCEKPDVFASEMICGKITEILRSVCKSMELEVPSAVKRKTDPRADVAVSFIDKMCGSVISCDDVARECCLSPRQLNRIFKSSMGVPVFEYITSSRVKYAKSLLADNSKSIKEIGFMLGFENECSFISFFKRNCGISPGVFRKGGFTEE
ncbi:MAG: AraC family transcriptional regulator [Clostridia bacterium]|nr:AraC family transcriptional regulator [Clostridia bacterium]